MLPSGSSCRHAGGRRGDAQWHGSSWGAWRTASRRFACNSCSRRHADVDAQSHKPACRICSRGNECGDVRGDVCTGCAGCRSTKHRVLRCPATVPIHPTRHRCGFRWQEVRDTCGLPWRTRIRKVFGSGNYGRWWRRWGIADPARRFDSPQNTACRCYGIRC